MKLILTYDEMGTIDVTCIPNNSIVIIGGSFSDAYQIPTEHYGT